MKKYSSSGCYLVKVLKIVQERLKFEELWSSPSPSFASGEAEAQRGDRTCLGSLSK